jgi:hypothetical protein
MPYPRFNKELKYKATTLHAWPYVEIWCVENIGSWNIDWYKMGIDPADSIFNPDYRTIYFFKTEQQALLFMLRWGS